MHDPDWNTHCNPRNGNRCLASLRNGLNLESFLRVLRARPPLPLLLSSLRARSPLSLPLSSLRARPPLSLLFSIPGWSTGVGCKLSEFLIKLLSISVSFQNSWRQCCRTNGRLQTRPLIFWKSKIGPTNKTLLLFENSIYSLQMAGICFGDNPKITKPPEKKQPFVGNGSHRCNALGWPNFFDQAPWLCHSKQPA